MNKDEVEAHLVFNKIQKKKALSEEFERLRPNWKGSVIRFASMFLGIAFFIWMYPEIMQQPVMYVLFILIFGINSVFHSESKRINKRIEVLHKLLKDDV
jgi:hypothetical protein